MAILQIDKKEYIKVEVWKMYSDGALNTLGHGIGVVLISSEEEHCPFISRLNFDCTNIVTEYEACIMGLQATIKKKVKRLKVYRDSNLAIY